MCAQRQKVNAGEARGIVLLGEKGALVPAMLFVRAAVADAGCAFVRPCPLSGKVRAHVSTLLAPVARAVVAARGKTVGGFRLSFSLPASAQLRGERIRVDGHSADLAIVLAMVSAALGEPLSEDVAATGQIDDEKGRVGMVRGIAEKLTLQDSTVSTVLVPDWKNDALFARLYPDEFVAVRTAIKGAARRVVLVADADDAFNIAKAEVRAVPAVSPTTEEPQKVSFAGSQTAATVGADDRARARGLLARCSESNLVATIDRPIEERFATFVPEMTTVETSLGLLAAVERLLRHLGVAADNEVVRGMEAARLTETAFAAEGGTPGAVRIVRHGRDGGLRGVLNQVVAQLKVERRQLFVQGALSSVIDPADGEDRLRLVQALLADNRALVPPDVELAPAEVLANSAERLVMAISAAAGQVTRAFSP